MIKNLHRFSIALAFLTITAAGIRPAEAQPLCGAGFTWVTQAPAVMFFDSSFAQPGTVVSWSWNFGDGTGSSLQNPVHTFNTTGTYNVCLTITTSAGCNNTTCQNVVVNAGCPMMASIAPDTVANTLTAVVTLGTPPYSYLWSNGATLATITGSVPGIYCVTVTDANNCTATSCYTIPAAGCFINATYQQAGNTVNFLGVVTGTYASLMWTFGDGDSSSAGNPVHTYANPGVYIACLTAYDSLGMACNSYCLTVNINAAPADTICGTVFLDLNGNGVLDPGEGGIGGGLVLIWGNGIQFTAQTDTSGFYFAPVIPGTYTVMYCTNPGNVFTVPLNVDSNGCAYYTAVITAGAGGCGYNFGIQNTAVTISGTLFIDANNNGIFDAAESGIPYQGVAVGSYSAFSNTTGAYTANVPAGTYNVSYTPTGLYAGYSLSTPGTISVNAATVGNTYGGNNFGLYIPPGSVNLSVNLIPHTTVTPGFAAWYTIQVCNIGVMPTAATLTMNYDAGLTLDYSTPAAASNNTVNHILTWNLPVIAPGQCKSVWVDFNASTGYVVGTSTTEFTLVLPVTGTDIDLSNNSDSVHQVVTASWDPNNKISIKTNTVNPSEQTISSINTDQGIEYTVNFQNTGTSPAVNVLVVDDLSADLIPSTFQLLSTSHNSSVTRNGSLVNFMFSQIMLPDSGTNEPASHGYIHFRVDAVNGLSTGHVISDEAAIYFDFNAPVITNPATVTMVNPLGVNEPGLPTLALQIAPNPFSAAALVTYELQSAGRATFDIHDATGRRVQQLDGGNKPAGRHAITLDAARLNRGIYLLTMYFNGRSAHYRISVL